MLLSIFSIIVNIVFSFVLNTDLYTDRAVMANGETREWHRSPISRLHISDQSIFLYLQLLFAAVSILTCVLVLFGVKNRIIRIIRLVSFIASAAMFIIIMIVTDNAHARYTY